VGSVLDTSYLRLGEMVNVRPDLLVVPSALPPFAKVRFSPLNGMNMKANETQVVESVLVINPGFLSKRRAAGTYTRVTVYPPTVTDEERNSGLMVGHKLFERARVDVLRI